MCAHSELKVRSKTINVVRSNGRVTDTSSAETLYLAFVTVFRCISSLNSESLRGYRG